LSDDFIVPGGSGGSQLAPGKAAPSAGFLSDACNSKIVNFEPPNWAFFSSTCERIAGLIPFGSAYGI
jgi:hypothetical protein